MIAVKFISNELIYALGSTLVHSLWQGALVGLLLAIALYLIPRKNAQLKYWMAITALTGMIVWCGYTFNNQLTSLVFQIPGGSYEAVESWQSYSAMEVPGTLALAAQQYFHQLIARTQPYMPTFVVLWMLGVVFLLLRLQGSIMYLGRLRHTKVRQVPDAWRTKVKELSLLMGIRGPVQVVESALAEIPMVIGHLKPMILLPVGMFTGLSAREVEAVLAHELAHVKRYDYLINIVQTVVESILFFNPAVWWVSHVIRKQREHCCDDLAVRCCGNQLFYAHALTNLGAWSLKAPRMSMGMFKSRGELFQRIKRLVYPHDRATLKEKWVPAAILLLTLTCLTWYSHKVQAQLAPQTELSAMPPVPMPDLYIMDEPMVQEFPMDTVPGSEEPEELPSMEPTEPPIDFDGDYDFDFEFEFNMPPMPDFHLVMPELGDIEIPDLEGVIAGLDALKDLPNQPILWEMEDMEALMKGIRPQLSDTTRKKITEALESQRKALERAREEQAKALEKARDQLRQSLDQGRPEELTEEEWEEAKARIRSAERSVNRAMEQAERSLERALQERERNMELHWEEVHRHQQDQLRAAQELQRRYQSDQARYQREVERARRHDARGEQRRQNEDMLRSALVEDGLINSHDADLHLEFKNELIKINGRRLQGDLKEKYRDILDEIYGSNSSGELHYKN